MDNSFICIREKQNKTKHLKIKAPILHEKITLYHIYPTPPLGQDMTQGQFLSEVKLNLNSEFSFS